MPVLMRPARSAALLRSALLLSALLLSALGLSACADFAASPDIVEAHVIAINDFHGNLDPPAKVDLPDPDNPLVMIPPDSGGAERMATLVHQLEAHPNTIMVAAGDLIGASPLLSNMFHDEPSIEALSQMGLAISTVGNHEFDKGIEELRRMQTGGCSPIDGCKGPHPFTGAKFHYLAANVIEDTDGRSVFPASEVRTLGGVKVGFIGLPLKGVPDLISPDARQGLTFKDEAETINAEAAKLKAEGVFAIIVLIHEGGYPAAGAEPCNGLSGAITRIVPKIDKSVSVVISGHTHMSYVCRIDGRLVTSAGRYSVMATWMTLKLDRRSGTIVDAQARNIVVRKDAYAKDKAQTALIAAYRKIADPIAHRVVGSVTGPISRTPNAAGESPLGDIIADSMLEAAPAGDAAAIAFLNPGGIRTDFPITSGQVTYGDLFTVQPFANALEEVTLTGAEIEAVLSQQFDRPGGQPDAVLQVSRGFTYRWRKDGAGKGRLEPGTIKLKGEPLDPRASYRVVINSFMLAGGDGFTGFAASRTVRALGPDVAALEAYFERRGSVGSSLDQARVIVDPPSSSSALGSQR